MDTKGPTENRTLSGTMAELVRRGFTEQFRVSDAHYMDQLYRTELRWRF